MKYFVAAFIIAALAGGCAYEPAEWYGIHNTVPDHPVSQYSDTSFYILPPIAHISHDQKPSVTAR